MTKLDDFIRFKRENGVKEETLKHYRHVIGWVLASAREQHINDDPETMTAAEFRAIIKEMGMLSNSIHTTTVIFKMYLRFVGNPIEIKFLVNDESPNAKWITEEEFIRIFQQCDDPTVKMIIHLGGNYGLRRKEISLLRFEDIGTRTIKVCGKGHGQGKYREVPLMENDQVLRDYIQWRINITTTAVKDKSEGRFVVTYFNKIITKFHPQSITQKMRKYFDSIGVDATTHSLRREFVTTTYRAGVDIVTIQRLVGHSSPIVTEKYIANDMDSAIKAINQRNLYISDKLMT